MKWLVALSLICCHHLVYSQWIEQVSVDIQTEVALSTVDNKGNLYVVNGAGDVLKYSSSGELLVEYSTVQQAEVHQIQVTTQLKVTLFYQNLQEYLTLNRYLSNPVSYSFADFDLGFVSEVTSNYQQNVWVIDLNSFSLKMLNPNRNLILEEKSLAHILNQDNVEIVDMISHQNKMYLATKKSGVLVFDNVGNYQVTFVNLQFDKLRFCKDEMLYKEKSQLVFRDLYSHDVRKYDFPDVEINDFSYCDDRLYIIGTSGFKIYKYLSDH